ncbi:MAG: type II CRISPR-associated endonuclease Cas1 [Bacteroidetes bacterium]|nr:type II CRISPR-associated endonuclease Cas1 [Bacteroidota bacterium]
MIKRTLYFGNPCYLSKRDLQLLVEFPEKEKEARTVPIEDIGIILLDNQQITITQGLMVALLANNAAVLSCDATHLPLGMMLNLNGHSELTEKWRYQLDSSLPLRKNLWMLTVKAKIANQAAVLKLKGIDADNMDHWVTQVKSGDPSNLESRAANYYWQRLFNPDVKFGGRHRFGDAPNNLLNYGYSIVRSMMARALVSSGMLPAVGIFHRNKYNPFCLADDIMEPYRPFVDLVVLDIIEKNDDIDELNTELKRALLQVATIDVVIENKVGPMMVQMQRTTASLMQCFMGHSRKILYPTIPHEF